MMDWVQYLDWAMFLGIVAYASFTWGVIIATVIDEYVNPEFHPPFP